MTSRTTQGGGEILSVSMLNECNKTIIYEVWCHSGKSPAEGFMESGQFTHIMTQCTN